MPITYAVKKSEKEGEEDLIVKSGFDQEFKMSTVKQNMDALEKKIKELTAQKQVEEAKMANVSEHHDVIATLSPLQMTAVAIYAQAKGMLEQVDAALKQAEDLTAQFTAEIADIVAQTGVVFPPVEEVKSEAAPVEEMKTEEATAPVESQQAAPVEAAAPIEGEVQA